MQCAMECGRHAENLACTYMPQEYGGWLMWYGELP